MAVRLAVDPNEDLQHLISNIKSQSQTSRDIVLMLPPKARALQTLDDFQILRKEISNSGVNLSFVGGGKTTRGLAKMLGFSTERGDGEDQDSGQLPLTGPAAPPPVSAPAQPSGFNDLPPGFVVANQAPGPQPQTGPNSFPFETGRSPFREDMTPPPPQNRRRQDMINELMDFDPGMPSTPLQPPPPAGNPSINGNGFGGDQVLTRENANQFFTPPPSAKSPFGDDFSQNGNVTSAPATRPPQPRAEFDFGGGGRTMNLEEAARSGLINGSSLGAEFNPTDFNSTNFNASNTVIDDTAGLDEDVPVGIDDRNDTVADRVRGSRSGVRNPDEVGGAGAGRGRRTPLQRPTRAPRTNRATAARVAGVAPSDSNILNRVRRILVPVQPAAPGGIRMSAPTLSPEKLMERNAQRRQATTFTIIGVLVIVLALIFLLWLVLPKSGGEQNGENVVPPVALTIPLRTEVRTETVRLQLVPGGSTNGVSGLAQATSATPGGAATTAPAATAGPATSATAAASTSGAASTGLLPVTMVNTGDLKKTAEHPATGVRNVPDQSARGPVTIFNSGSSPKSYGAGAVLYISPSGVSYRLVQGITVNGGNVFSGKPATASGTVVADKAGPVGNLDKPVTRLLSDAVGVQIGPISGGTEKQEKIIQQSDVDDLYRQLQSQVRGDAASKLQYDSATQAPLILKSSDPKCSLNNKNVGDVADSFSATCSMSVEAAIYNTQNLTQTVRSQMVKDPGFKLDENTKVELVGEPKLTQNGNQNFVDVQAKGRLIPVVDPEAIKQAIAGKPLSSTPTQSLTPGATVSSTVTAPREDVRSILIKNFPQVDTTLLNLDSIKQDALPEASKLTINLVPDYQVIENARTTPGSSASPGAPTDASGTAPTGATTQASSASTTPAPAGSPKS